MVSESISPRKIEIIGDELAIVWSDQTETYLKLEPLRRHCPCAACGGEPDLLNPAVRPRVNYSPKSFQLKAVRQAGGYALQPIWADGHETGLYTFNYLRALGARIGHELT